MIWGGLLSGALKVAKAVPVWAWALAAVLAWGAFQKHAATRATKAAEQAQASATMHAAAAAAEQRERELEARLASQTRKVTDAYNAQLAAARRSAASARDELDRVRDAIAAAPGACAPGHGSSTPGAADGAAGLRQVLRECVGTVQALAEAADADAAKLTGLQSYVHATRSPQ